MSAEQRLDRLYPALSAKERGLLVLQAYKAGEQPDRLIYRTTPSSQGSAFNRYIRLMNACNRELATVLMMIREHIGKTDLRYAWFMTLCLWGMETQFLGDEVLAATKDRTIRRDVRRMMRRAPGYLTLPVDLTLPRAERDPFKKGYGDGLARAVLLGIKHGLEQHWCELRSIEIALAEVAEEFDGEDPLRADTRALLDDCLRSCRELRDEMADYVAIELLEPAEEDIEQVRRLIETVVEKG
jgi:hypothetical protein